MAFSNYWRGDRDRNRAEWQRTRREWGSSRDLNLESSAQAEGFQRRGLREGSDYYGNDPERYGAGNYDRYEREYADRERFDRGSSGSWETDDDTRRYGGGGSSLGDRWQNSYTGRPGAYFRYAGYSGYGGGDYGERDSERGYEGSLFTGGGDDRVQQFGERAFSRSDGRFRGRGPKGYRRSDERIREDACERLTDDDWIDASNIEVNVKDCEVTLTGFVTSREAKRRAEDIVEHLSGVKDVHNRLRVASETASDAQRQVATTR
jgi:hypothetical protein